MLLQDYLFCLKTLKPIGDIIDPFDGKHDIFNWKLKCVGRTRDRIKEDGLRILRALRFIVTKSIDPDNNLSKEISDVRSWEFMNDTVSVERIREELNKMMQFDTSLAIATITNRLPCEALPILFNKVWLKPTLEKKKGN